MADTTKPIPNPYRTCAKLPSTDAQYRCYKTYARWDNPDNHPNIPPTCKDKSGKFQAVRYGFALAYIRNDDKNITRWESIYGIPQTYFYIPVREVADKSLNGRIAYDFNRDQQLDYIFAESTKKLDNPELRLAVCISGKRGYKRQPLELPISPSYLDSYGGISQVVHAFSLDNGLLSIKSAAIFYEQGYKLTQNWFNWDKVRHAFVWQKIFHTELGDGSRLGSEKTSSSEYAKVYDLHNKQYQENWVCNDSASETNAKCKFTEQGKIRWKGEIPALGVDHFMGPLGSFSTESIYYLGASDADIIRTPSLLDTDFLIIETPLKTPARKAK